MHKCSIRSLALVAVLFAVALILGCNDSNASRSSLDLQPLQGDLDIGKVWEQTDFHWKLRVRNNSWRTIRVSDIRVSCNCTAVDPKEFEVGPQESIQLNVALDLTSRSTGNTFPGQETPFKVQLTPVISGSGPQIPWDLTGTIQPIAVLDPNPLELYIPPTNVGLKVSAKSRITALFPVDRIIASPATGVPGIVRIEKTRAQQFSLEFAPAQSLFLAGKNEFDVPLEIWPESASPQFHKLLLHVVVVSPPDLYAIPTEVTFGELEIGGEHSREVVIGSANDEPFTIQNIVCEAECFHVSESTRNTSIGATFVATCKPNTLGVNRGNIKVSIFYPHSARVSDVIIPVSYYGVPQGL